MLLVLFMIYLPEASTTLLLELETGDEGGGGVVFVGVVFGVIVVFEVGSLFSTVSSTGLVNFGEPVSTDYQRIFIL